MCACVCVCVCVKRTFTHKSMYVRNFCHTHNRIDLFRTTSHFYVFILHLFVVVVVCMWLQCTHQTELSISMHHHVNFY